METKLELMKAITALQAVLLELIEEPDNLVSRPMFKVMLKLVERLGK